MLLYVCTSMYVRSRADSAQPLCHGIATRPVACCCPQQENPENRWLDACNLLPSPLRCRPLQHLCLRVAPVPAAETISVGIACLRAAIDLALASHTPRLHVHQRCHRIWTPKGARIGQGTSAGKSHCICKAPNPALQPSHLREVLGPFSTRQGGQDIRSSLGPWDPWNQ